MPTEPATDARLAPVPSAVAAPCTAIQTPGVAPAMAPSTMPRRTATGTCGRARSSASRAASIRAACASDVSTPPGSAAAPCTPHRCSARRTAGMRDSVDASGMARIESTTLIVRSASASIASSTHASIAYVIHSATGLPPSMERRDG